MMFSITGYTHISSLKFWNKIFYINGEAEIIFCHENTIGDAVIGFKSIVQNRENMYLTKNSATMDKDFAVLLS